MEEVQASRSTRLRGHGRVGPALGLGDRFGNTAASGHASIGAFAVVCLRSGLRLAAVSGSRLPIRRRM